MSISQKGVANVLPLATVFFIGVAIGIPDIATAQELAVCTASGNTLGEANEEFEKSCPGRIRVDCDPSGNGWQCSTQTIASVSSPSTLIPTSSAPVTGSQLLTIQAENASQTNGSGWSTESALNGFSGSGYIIWRGQDDFRASENEPPVGIKAYDFAVTQAGTYEFTARVQARVGNGSAAADKDNDAWVRFTSGSATSGVPGNAAKWTKFFVSGDDENWKNYSSGEQYDPTFFTSIQRDLPAGNHRVLIGGRSARFAIDTVGLKLIRTSGGNTPVSAAPPVAPAPDTTASVDGSCIAQGSSLAQARANYSSSCPTLPRQDCDPVNGGQWICSSDNIVSGAFPVASNPVSATEPPQSQENTVSPPSTGACSAQGASLAQARTNYANSCPTIARQDCDPIRGGNWICSSENMNNGTPSPASVPTPANLQAPTPTALLTLAPPAPAPTGADATGRISASDLLALHYDNCPDRDDGHAIVAGKAVVDQNNLQNIIVVNGTCGAGIRDRYQPSSAEVLNAVWGNDWLDSFNQETLSVNTSAERWAATLANGDDVWVAEGGPSDFTAKVLQRIGDLYPSVDRKRIRVVQHSTVPRFNETVTSPAALALVKNVTDYRPIPDGNFANNGSGKMAGRSAYFVTTARQSRYASEWAVAFNYLNPEERLDFSDTVEMLYIVDDTTTLTADDFANNYLQ